MNPVSDSLPQLPQTMQEEKALLENYQPYTNMQSSPELNADRPISPTAICTVMQILKADPKRYGFSIEDMSRQMHAFHQHKSHWMMGVEGGAIKITQANLKEACLQWLKNAEKCHAAAIAADNKSSEA